MVKLYKYAAGGDKKKENEDEIEESHVGAAMSDLTNRR
jgi:hypothetical protein